MAASIILSVVIPALNAAATLARTLDSLLAQQRGDWEAVIVDDGSTDETRAIAESYIVRDGRFRLLSDGRRPEGAAAARNRGVAEAAGRWLLFLDADDWIEPSFTTEMIGALESQSGARVAYCGGRYVSPDDVAGPTWFSGEVAQSPFEVLARQCPIVIHGVVTERALVNDVGGFDPSLRTSEDWDLWHRIARTGAEFLAVPSPLATYRLRRNSLSSDPRGMLRDAKIVVARAFAPDPRVPKPAPLHASGADSELAGSQELAIGQFALWCAAFDVGAGGSGHDMIMPLPFGWTDPLDACRATILAGLRSGARVVPGEPIGDGLAFLAAVRDLLAEVERVIGRPGFARVLEFALEPEVFRPAQLTESVATGRALHVRLDVAALHDLEVPSDADIVRIDFRAARQTLAHAEIAVFGGLSGGELTALALETVGLSVFLRRSGFLRRPLFWLNLAVAVAHLPAKLIHARPRRGPRSAFQLRALAKRALGDATLATARVHDKSENERTFEQIAGEARAKASAIEFAVPAIALASAQLHESRYPSQSLHPRRQRSRFWDDVYRKPDPWAYGSRYEQLKYRRQLDLVPRDRPARALELACSEGTFTRMLAGSVGQLTATDISGVALDRARARCSGISNIDFRRLDLFNEVIPKDLDLLVCSEVLYDLAGRADVARIAEKFAASLAPGGRLLTAHSHILKNDPGRTAFDWEDNVGAAIIAEVFAATPGLALERSVQTDLYRVDLFRRLAKGEIPPSARIDAVEQGPPPEPNFARHIVWGGAIARRAEVQKSERTHRLPILAYHRIADDGPAGLARYRLKPAAFAGQMHWLRRHGYHAVTSTDVLRHLASGRPFEGRPVMISFDDGYRDFHDAAWPILRAHDFVAEVFVVTDRVGGTADWDVNFGAPAPLMDWSEIRSLSAAGVRFGSHMASHRHTAELSSRQLAGEAAGSRAAVEKVTGMECLAIAAPFGEADERFVRVARQCGFRLGLTAAPGFACLASPPLRLPRIEVAGDWSLDAFIGAVRG